MTNNWSFVTSHSSLIQVSRVTQISSSLNLQILQQCRLDIELHHVTLSLTEGNVIHGEFPAVKIPVQAKIRCGEVAQAEIGELQRFVARIAHIVATVEADGKALHKSNITTES